MSEGAESTAADTGGASAEPSAPSAAPEVESGGAPADVETPSESAPAPARKWALKYDGKDHEIDSEEELVKLAQKGLGADRRFEEAATTRKQVEAAARKMADDPLGVLSALYGDEGKAAQIAATKMMERPGVRAEVQRLLLEHPEARAELEAAMYERLRYEGLPEDERKRIDEDRTLREKASKVERYEAEERKRAEAAERQRREQAHAVEVERLQRTYAEEARTSLAAVGLDPNDPDVSERWILQRSAALDQGVELTAAEAAQRVADRIGGSRKGYLESLAKLEGDALLAALPPAVLAKINAANAARVTGAVRAKTREAQTGAPRKAPPAAKPKMEVSTDAWLRAMKRLGVDEANRRLAAGESLER